VFNTHLSLPTPFSREFWSQKSKMGFGSNQLQEARKLHEFIAKHAAGEAHIVCGDFNSPPCSPVYRYLTEEAQLRCAKAAVGHCKVDDPRSFPTAGFLRMRMHLDHMFAGGPVRWLDLEGSSPFGDPQGAFFGLSDHVPLIGRFDWSRAPSDEQPFPRS
jgi:endonuclease/exonuclease/phosphatase family metal-dependent hydrolase